MLCSFFSLLCRFNGHLKHFMISCDDATGFLYVGDRDKPYHSLQELVQEGLTTLYLDLKAGCYIDLMCDLTNFHNGSSLKNGHSKFNYSNNTSRKNSSSPSPSASTASRSSIVSLKLKENIFKNLFTPWFMTLTHVNGYNVSCAKIVSKYAA